MKSFAKWSGRKASRGVRVSGLLAAAAAVLAAGASVATAGDAADRAERVERLLASMTLEEKAGQMTQMTLGALSSERGWVGTEQALDMQKVRDAIVRDHVGSVLNTFDKAMPASKWRDVIGEIQRVATEETRLGVPVIYGVDSVHGANYVVGATIFPQNLAMGATFNPELVRLSNEVTARETRAAGPTWNFSPVADVARQPLWSRYFECFGEDPHLAAVMTAAAVRGLEGDDLSSSGSVAACIKHFLGYSMPYSGRDRTPAYIPTPMLHDVFLPPVAAGLDAGSRTIMVNSGSVNGEPVHASRRLLTGLLRDRLGFDGVILTDWEDVIKLHRVHRVAADEKEATYQSVMAGIDMSMVPNSSSFAGHVVDLVREGRIPVGRIDASVRRILTLKDELGLFERPMPSGPTAVGGAEAASLSHEAAQQSMVLLVNEGGVLPAAEDTRILVTGPTADDLPALHGSWTYSWQGTEAALYPETPTIVDALRTRFGAANVTYEPGSGFEDAMDLAAAERAARDADLVVLCLGEIPSTEQPGDIRDLNLPAGQIELMQRMTSTGTPVVLVMVSNRPRLLGPGVANIDAMIWAGQPGPHGSTAIAELIAGDFNPSGRLPFTYPRHHGELLTYDRTHADGETLTQEFQWTDAFTPLFRFGQGLSYTTYEFEDLRVSLGADGRSVTAEVRVRNSGERDGEVPVLVFVSDEYASVIQPVERLKAFDRVAVGAGASEVARFDLPLDAFTFSDLDGRRVFEDGAFTVRVGELSVPVTLSMGANGELSMN